MNEPLTNEYQQSPLGLVGESRRMRNSLRTNTTRIETMVGNKLPTLRASAIRHRSGVFYSGTLLWAQIFQLDFLHTVYPAN